jgi:hypothetical protein
VVRVADFQVHKLTTTIDWRWKMTPDKRNKVLMMLGLVCYLINNSCLIMYNVTNPFIGKQTLVITFFLTPVVLAGIAVLSVLGVLSEWENVNWSGSCRAKRGNRPCQV